MYLMQPRMLNRMGQGPEQRRQTLGGLVLIDYHYHSLSTKKDQTRDEAGKAPIMPKIPYGLRTPSESRLSKLALSPFP
jgi:hypothetical protein